MPDDAPESDPDGAAESEEPEWEDPGPVPSSPEPVGATHLPLEDPSDPALDDPEDAGDAAAPGVAREIVAAYVSRPKVREHLVARVRRKVPRREVEDLVEDIRLLALEAKSMPRTEAAIPAWLDTIADRRVAKFTAKQKRRARYETQADDKTVAEVEAPPPEDEQALEKWMILPWIEGEVQFVPKDAEFLWLLRKKARSGKTNAEVAAELGTTEDAIKARLQRFKEKYGPKRTKYLIQIGLIWGIVLVTAIALAAYVLRGLFATPPPMPPPAPSITAPVETATVFEPAEPPPMPAPTEQPTVPPKRPRRPPGR